MKYGTCSYIPELFHFSLLAYLAYFRESVSTSLNKNESLFMRMQVVQTILETCQKTKAFPKHPVPCQVCSKKGDYPDLFLVFSDGTGTQNFLFDREGVDWILRVLLLAHSRWAP